MADRNGGVVVIRSNHCLKTKAPKEINQISLRSGKASAGKRQSVRETGHDKNVQSSVPFFLSHTSTFVPVWMVLFRACHGASLGKSSTAPCGGHVGCPVLQNHPASLQPSEDLQRPLPGRLSSIVWPINIHKIPQLLGGNT